MTTEPFLSARVWQGGRIGPSRWDPASLAPQGVPGPPPNPCWQLESLPCTRLLSDLQRLRMPEEISPRGSSSSAVPSSELSCSLLSLPCAAASPALRGKGALPCASSLGDLSSKTAAGGDVCMWAWPTLSPKTSLLASQGCFKTPTHLPGASTSPSLSFLG